MAAFVVRYTLHLTTLLHDDDDDDGWLFDLGDPGQTKPFVLRGFCYRRYVLKFGVHQ